MFSSIRSQFVIVLFTIFVSYMILPSYAFGQDSDGDGLPDDWENLHGCLDSGSYDSDRDQDADGKTSLEEYQYSPSMNPCYADSDLDGSDDGEEMDGGSNPLDSYVVPGLAKHGSDMRITYGSGEGLRPVIVWADSVYALAWEDYRDANWEIYFRRLSEDGDTLGSDTKITDNIRVSNNAALVWTGSEFGVVWRDNRDFNYELYFSRLSSSGEAIDPEKRITSYIRDCYQPTLAWSGSEYGVAWDDYKSSAWEIYFSRLGADGTIIGPEYRVTSQSAESRVPTMVWSGSEFGLAWYDWRNGNPDGYFARISAGGSKIGSDLLFNGDGANSWGPAPVWTGSEYGIAWEDERDVNMEVYFARVSSAGSTVGPNKKITNALGSSTSASIAWRGTEYGVLWHDDRDGNNEIYFARLAADGQKIGKDLRLTYNSADSKRPSFAWSGSEYGITWEDNRSGVFQIYFALAGPDGDGDKISDADEASYGTDAGDYDSDGDGMPDGWEALYSGCGLDPMTGDSLEDHDGDGVSNLAEYNISPCMNPCDVDSDHDGMGDGWEAQNLACVDPVVGDSLGDPDGEGLSNVEEMSANSDPCDDDSDGAGEDDYSEVSHGRDPNLPDDDLTVIYIGFGLGDWTYPYYTGREDSRTEVIYYSDELGCSGNIEEVALEVRTVPGQMMENFTIRMRHVTFDEYPAFPDTAWSDTSGWMVVYRHDALVDQTGYFSFVLDTPFPYNGNDNVVMDFSFDNDSYTTPGEVYYFTDNYRTIYRSVYNGYGDPTSWTGTSSPQPYRENKVPNLKIWKAPDPDFDDDGLYNSLEILIGTDENDPDSDHDGINDGDEYYLYDTDPLYWDTDGDALPDLFEVAHLEGHALNLDPLDPDDGMEADFDGDGNPNSHEYWNGTNIWNEDARGGEGCYCWADSGDTLTADGLASPLDLAVIRSRISLSPVKYTGVLPPNGDTQELDMDEIISALDLSILKSMVTLASTGGNPSIPTSLEIYGDTALSIEVGMTGHVTVGVKNDYPNYTSGFGVIFDIGEESVGTATILGGDGNGSEGGRYDVSGPIADGGRSRIVIRVDTAGTIRIRAHLPECGSGGVGRYAGAIEVYPALEINSN